MVMAWMLDGKDVVVSKKMRYNTRTLQKGSSVLNRTMAVEECGAFQGERPGFRSPAAGRGRRRPLGVDKVQVVPETVAWCIAMSVFGIWWVCEV